MSRPLQAEAPPEQKPAYKKYAAAALAVAALALLAWVLLAPAPLRTELSPVTVGPMQVSVGNQGQVRIHDKYVLAAPIAGRIARSLLDDGDPVRQGQVLATLHPAPMDLRQREDGG